ncbi:hypothetical protein BJY52DRAFT_1190901 [Lactarius psammicola]|nr:hypothetical protein BJY52DRAFT_1190901 [Lactarius psammicola]
MLFYKPLVSLVTAMALASSVAASVTPERRTGPTPVTGDQCTANNNYLTCCNSSSLLTITDPLAVLLLPLGLNLNLLVGLTCAITGTVACGTQQSLCCQGVMNQQGLVNVGLNCVPIAV